jgi:hypothetical protein
MPKAIRGGVGADHLYNTSRLTLRAPAQVRQEISNAKYQRCDVVAVSQKTTPLKGSHGPAVTERWWRRWCSLRNIHSPSGLTLHRLDGANRYVSTGVDFADNACRQRVQTTRADNASTGGESKFTFGEVALSSVALTGQSKTLLNT